jgi:hypothetical protein
VGVSHTVALPHALLSGTYSRAKKQLRRLAKKFHLSFALKKATLLLACGLGSVW